ncbi:MAG: CaiB/BaiF CoA-transferase family protein [Acetobacteraceae bacterium]|nr:CaiB/BaiF CoA-transferase family protein [Acetobacteraceae bacterium]
MQAPLAGLRVVEFTHMIMGPACGLALAELGADVIKVEPAGKGDQTRWLKGAGTGFFAIMNRNKRSFAVDLKSPDGIAQVRALVRTADVVVENFRPGALDKLGLSSEALRAENPRLIYCSCKGFLPGPYEKRVALDEVVQMMGGLAYMTGLPGRPMRAGSSVNDILGGTFAALGILAAVEERHRTGRGKHVQSGLFETNAVLVAQHMAQAFISGEAPPPMGVKRPAWPIYDIFECSDGESVFVGVVTDTQWQLFCAQFGLDALATDPSLDTQEARRGARDRVLPLVAAALRTYSKPELMAKCEALGLPFAPIGKPWDLFEDPHLTASGGLLPVTLADGRVANFPAYPLALDGERLTLRHDVPTLGQHNEEILAELREQAGQGT